LTGYPAISAARVCCAVTVDAHEEQQRGVRHGHFVVQTLPLPLAMPMLPVL
jgi:hypothetical protein